MPLAAGVGLNLVADHQFRQRGTTAKPFQRSTALITSECFRRSRNPMYLGMVLIVAGVAVFAGSAGPWIVVVALVVLPDRIFIAPEECIMAKTFGNAFGQYRTHTRR
jgi:protein-S-isoprenylcysteine O-methyltransferase Ste14